MDFCITLEGVHKLRLQEEGGKYVVKKNRLFVNFYNIENVNRLRRVGSHKKTTLVNVVCECPVTL